MDMKIRIYIKNFQILEGSGREEKINVSTLFIKVYVGKLLTA